MGRKYKEIFYQKEYMNVSEHNNRRLAWLAIREITIKVNVAYHDIAIRTAKIKNSIQNILISQFF
jgi:hypothetical protein